MKNKINICTRVAALTQYIKSSNTTKEQEEHVINELHNIKVSAQHMENRMFKYRKAIELLGFRRDKRIKAKLYKEDKNE